MLAGGATTRAEMPDDERRETCYPANREPAGARHARVTKMGSEKRRMNQTGGMGTLRNTALSLGLGTMVALSVLSQAGCRVTDEDVHLWGRKASGPRRLVAVLTHDKYPIELRTEAAMTMVTMKPRSGRAVGLLGSDEFPGLLSTLSDLPAAQRDLIVEGIVPQLEKGITTPPPAEPEVDPSFAYKDAAFALLSHDGGSLVRPEELKKRLLQALTVWTQTDFEKRFDNTAQLYGMEQVLRLLREDGVRGLTPLLQADFKNLDNVARLVRELGDDATKQDASERLVKVAEHVNSSAWIEQKTPAVQAANQASQLEVTEKQLQAQLTAFQEEELLRVFAAMKNVGQKPVVDYLIAYAQNKDNQETRRAAALAALEGNLSRGNAEHARIMLDFVASDEIPDSIRDVAARRVGELSRDQVAERLYSLFDNPRWQVRWTVASLLLRMSEAKHLDEFMTRLGRTKTLAMSEPLAYGPLLAGLKGFTPESMIPKYADVKQPVPLRLTALGYYYRFGNKTDVSKVQAYAKDSAKVPPCPAEAQACAWQCGVTENDKQVLKEVTTVGEFVNYCILPGLASRDAEPQAEAEASPAEPSAPATP